MSLKKVCQSCGKEIVNGQRAVKVEVGKYFVGTDGSRLHARILGPKSVDWFHADCPVAIRKTIKQDG